VDVRVAVDTSVPVRSASTIVTLPEDPRRRENRPLVIATLSIADELPSHASPLALASATASPTAARVRCPVGMNETTLTSSSVNPLN